jgi:hypothetical protein
MSREHFFFTVVVKKKCLSLDAIRWHKQTLGKRFWALPRFAAAIANLKARRLRLIGSWDTILGSSQTTFPLSRAQLS